jgi:hypothetical protein
MEEEEEEILQEEGRRCPRVPEWDSDMSSTDSSSDEDATNIAVNKGLLFPTSATSASWQRTTRKRRYKLEPTPSILHLVMRVVLVMIRITCLVFLPTLTCNKRKIK